MIAEVIILGCHYDIPFNDIFLQSLLDKASSLKSQ